VANPGLIYVYFGFGSRNRGGALLLLGVQ